MAIYHCSVKIIGRSAGRSSVAAAAYRAGEDLINEYDGVEHDFRKKNWVEYTEIILPANAPREYADRSTLWNAVEKAEKSQDAQLSREFELALPSEMTREQQLEAVHAVLNNKLVSEGMVADIAIHNPPVTNDRHQPIDKDEHVTKDMSKMMFINPHAHILVTVRPMDENGKWQKKAEIEYLCKKDNEEKAFTAEEFQKAKEEGWEKQYKYEVDKKKIWLTASEGNEKDLKRVNRSPKTSRFGRRNEITESLNSKDRIFEWRQYWEKVVNDEFEKMNSEIRIDSRSFKNQGRIAEEPTLHMGSSATNMEKRADREVREGKSESEVIRSDIGNINREIKAHNKFVRELKAKLAAIADKAKDFIEETTRKLEGIRAKVIGNNYEETVLSHKYNYMTSKIGSEENKLREYSDNISGIQTVIKGTTSKIKDLQQELSKYSPLQFRKKADIQKQLQTEQEKIENYNEYLSNISLQYGYAAPNDYKKAKAEFDQRLKEYTKLEGTLKTIRDDNNTLVSDYSKQISETEPIDLNNLDQKRKEVRSEAEGAVKEKLEKKYGKAFDSETYSDAKSKADDMLGIGSGKKMEKISLTQELLKKQHKSHHHR